MPTSPFISAINQLADEKNLDKTTVIETIEAALAAAYRKDYGKPKQIVRAKFNIDSGQFEVFQVFEIIKPDKETPLDPEYQIDLKLAKKTDKSAKEGGEILKPLPYHDDFGRIAAQTAKQVIIQRLREAERDMIFNEYKQKEDQIITATVQQIDGAVAIINLGKANGVILPSDQVLGERYYIGQRLRVYIKSVEISNRGPRIMVSRTDPGLVKGLFTLEVPEILAGSVVIMGIAREPGVRSKVSVKANDTALDPIGSVVGQRGARIQAVLAEIGEEKIDIIAWSHDPAQYITNSLSPAKIDQVKITKKTQKAKVYVPDDQLSLAIGRGGQNVRLASKLTGFTIDIVKEQDKTKLKTKNQAETPQPDQGKKENPPQKKEQKPKKIKPAKKSTKEKSDGQP